MTTLSVLMGGIGSSTSPFVNTSAGLASAIVSGYDTTVIVSGGSSASSIEGYGAAATGGTGYSVVNVTTLANSGAGSLREALASGNRIVRFTVGGTITLLSSILTIGGNNITIDGSTAPGNGITIKGRAIWVNGISNIIFQQLHFRDQEDGTASPYVDDAITIINGATSIVVDHCSFSNQEDGCVDISINCADISIQWNMFGPTRRGQAQGYLVNDQFRNSNRVTWHHNLWIDDTVFDAGWFSRTPGLGDTANPDTLGSTLTADIRCNVVWAPINGYVGAIVQSNTKANVVKHYFYGRSGQTGINYVVQTQLGGQAYSSGNYNKRGGVTTTTTAMSEIVPPVGKRVTEEATVALAAAAVLAGVGCRVGGLDATDAAAIAAIEAVGL